MIKTIFFDIGGVLLNIYPEKTLEFLSSITNISDKELLNCFPVEEHHRYEEGEISDEEFFYSVKSSLPNSSDLTIDQFWEAWSMMVGDETGVVDIMNNLTNNYSVWLLSNTNRYHIIQEERFKLFDKIDGAIYSFEVGSRKPGKKIFDIALKTANTFPEETLFIDDLIENVEKARSMNINAIHFISESDLRDKLAGLTVG